MPPRGVAALVALLAFGACADDVAPRPTHATLSGEVARVGASSIDRPLVAAVVRASAIAPSDAADRLVDDALLAADARRRRFDRAPGTAWDVSAALARATSVHVLDDAAGPATDEELAYAVVVHAVVVRGPAVPRGRATAVADAIASSVANAKSPEEFMSRAAAAAPHDVDVRIEPLPPFGMDGRSEEGDSFDPTFVAAAFSLPRPGDTSPVVETPFGWHVIRLVERRIPDPSTLERRRAALADAVVAARARARTDAILASRKASTRVDISSAADSLMAEAITGHR